LYADPHSWIDAIHPDDRERILKGYHGQGRTQSHQDEFRIIRPDGSIRWIRDRSFPVRDEQGQVVRLCGVAEDVTDRKHLQDQLRQAQKMEAIGQLASGVAHDFNNLLTVISGFSEIILQQLPEDHPHRNMLVEVRRAGERAEGLTRQLLAFSRKQVLVPKILDLNVLVGETEKMLRRLIGEDIEIVTVKGAGLWPVKADPGQVEQILMNLAINARDAMPQGGKFTIETANVTLDESYAVVRSEVHPGNHVMLALTDTGCGMDRATQARIFEPFFTTKGPGVGTGLGLAISHQIVLDHGGRIEVESQLGRGSTFRVVLG
jgi:signal transduction histidine kinase